MTSRAPTLKDLAALYEKVLEAKVACHVLERTVSGMVEAMARAEEVEERLRASRKARSLERIVRALLKYINRTPELLSLLYDLDLLPEQLERDSFQWRQMLILANWHHKTIRQRPNDQSAATGAGKP